MSSRYVATVLPTLASRLCCINRGSVKRDGQSESLPHVDLQTPPLSSRDHPAVRWHCKYGISYRDLTEMMSERGVKTQTDLAVSNDLYKFTYLKRRFPGLSGLSGN
jgi:hypothetical protein